VLTVSAADPEASRVSLPFTAREHAPALIVPWPELRISSPAGGAIRNVEGRGPPPRSTRFATPSLRAPPVA
jgi:hypothetical protein